jgi:hypothetical protein
LLGANTLPYYEQLQNTDIKSFMTVRPEQKKIILPQSGSTNHHRLKKAKDWKMSCGVMTLGIIL